jgi:hypothetical protein
MESAKGKRKSTRSANGCWTCRLRRKKCDEKHPSCDICLSHNLVCDGYDKRPEIMDHGVQEAAYIEILKETVHQSMSRRKRRRSQKSHSVSSIDQTLNGINIDLNSLVETDDMAAIWYPVDNEDPSCTVESIEDLFKIDVSADSILSQSPIRYASE